MAYKIRNYDLGVVFGSPSHDSDHEILYVLDKKIPLICTFFLLRFILHGIHVFKNI